MGRRRKAKTPSKEYQLKIARRLRALLKEEVKTEWLAMQEQPTLYAPQIDIAVGPFVYDDSCIPEKHDPLVRKWKGLINDMLTCHKQNVEYLHWENCQTTLHNVCFKNKTARCLMAIEIENQVSRKHLIGGITNASILGRVGILVAFNQDKLIASARIRQYLWFMSRAGGLDTTNLLILTKEQLADILSI
jgi:hypothetical protein